VGSSRRDLDIVVYGATGFIGKLTANYLASSRAEARVALAGRSLDRLHAVRSSLGTAAQEWRLIVADVSQPEALRAMAARTQVVVNAVGPYTTHGLPVVGAGGGAGAD
jgi:trans-enoyl reductase